MDDLAERYALACALKLAGARPEEASCQPPVCTLREGPRCRRRGRAPSARRHAHHLRVRWPLRGLIQA
jgi:hypothetical protein